MSDPLDGGIFGGQSSGEHTPVLVEPVLELLSVRGGDVVLDVTVGLAGHARLLALQAGREGRLIALDRDPGCLAVARRALSDAPCRVDLRHADFGSVTEVLKELRVEGVDVLLADLGVNSAQLEDAARGFSFQSDGPLDMRLDPGASTTAADLVNRLGEKELGDLLYEHSQEPGSRKIARRICERRRNGRITTTHALAVTVCEALGVRPDAHPGKIHPATRTFLALRMAVNDELGALRRLLDSAPEVLRSGGRMGVISFHSTEDRLVKRDFLKRRAEGVYRIVTRKPVVADELERRRNPRSRSAKLRVVMRLAPGDVDRGAPDPVSDDDDETD